jgi:hypothetical protein
VGIYVSVGGLVFAVVSSLVVLAYHTGRVSMRVDTLEQLRLEARVELTAWRHEIREDISAVFTALRRMEQLIKGGDE